MVRIPFPTRLESFLCIVLVFLWASLPLLHSSRNVSIFSLRAPLPDRQKVQKSHFCSPFFERRKTRLCGLWVEVSSLLFSLSAVSFRLLSGYQRQGHVPSSRSHTVSLAGLIPVSQPRSVFHGALRIFHRSCFNPRGLGRERESPPPGGQRGLDTLKGP